MGHCEILWDITPNQGLKPSPQHDMGHVSTDNQEFP